MSMLLRLTVDKSLSGVPSTFVFTQVPPRYKWDYYLSLGYAEDENHSGTYVTNRSA